VNKQYRILVLGNSVRLRSQTGLQLWRIFWSKTDEVTVEWRTLNNEELNDLNSSPNIFGVIKLRMRWVEHVSRTGMIRCVYRVLVGKPGDKRPLGRLRRKWENNIKMNLQEVGCGGIDWIDVAQDRDRWRALVIGVMNLQVL